MPQNVVNTGSVYKPNPLPGRHLFYNLQRKNPSSNTKMGLSHAQQSMRLAALQRRDMFRHWKVFARILGARPNRRFLLPKPMSKSRASFGVSISVGVI